MGYDDRGTEPSLPYSGEQACIGRFRFMGKHCSEFWNPSLDFDHSLAPYTNRCTGIEFKCLNLMKLGLIICACSVPGKYTGNVDGVNGSL